MSLDTTSNRANLSDATNSYDGLQHRVSWQSAFWPVVACIIAVMLQETGRVCAAQHRYSYALRSSPLVSAVDTFTMLLKLAWLLGVGCSVRVAARHIWYERFLILEEESPHPDDYVKLPLDSMKKIYDYMWRQPDSSTGHSTSGRDDRPTPASAVQNNLANSKDIYTCSGAPPTQIYAQTPGDYTASVHLDTLTYTESRSTQSSSGATTSMSSVVATLSRKEEECFGQTADRANCCTGEILPVQSSGHPVAESGENNDVEQGLAAGLVEDASPAELAEYHTTLPGSTVDHTWRISMASFLLGALPQAIKIFGLKGVPVTQTLVAIMLVSFMVPEILRSIAGPPGKVNLHPMPIVLNAKAFLSHISSLIYAGTLFLSFLLAHVAVVYLFSSRKCIEYTNCIVLFVAPACIAHAYVATFTCCFISKNLFTSCLCTAPRMVFNLPPRFTKISLSVRSGVVHYTAILLAFQPSAVDYWLPSFLLFLLILAANISFMAYFFAEAWYITWLPPIVGFFIAIPLLVQVLYLFYCVAFKGVFSYYPRYLFGLEGSTEEFAAGMIVLGNLSLILIGYIHEWDDTAYTYKPAWAEYLG